MGRSGATLLALLVLTNAAWLVWALGRSSARDAPPDGVDRPTASGRATEPPPAPPPPRAGGSALPPPRAVAPPPAAPSSSAEEPSTALTLDRASAAMVQAWAADALQIADAALRAQALDRIEAALRSTDPAMVLAGTSALMKIWEVPYDRERFRPLLMALLDSRDAEVRARAVWSLWSFPITPDQVERVMALAADPVPSVRSRLGRGLTSIGGELTVPAVERAAMALLQDADRDVVRNAIRGMADHELTPALEARLLELAPDPGLRETTIQVLAGVKNKGERTVDALVVALFEPATRESALRGLLKDIPPAAHERVADALLRCFPEGSYREQIDAVRALALYGSAKHLPALDALGDNELASDGLRSSARYAGRQIRRRLERG